MEKKPKMLCMVDLKLVPEVIGQLSSVAEVDYAAADYEELLNTIGAYDIYFGHIDVKIDAAIISRADRLKLIATPSTGTDHIDKEAAKKRNIKIVSITEEYELLEQFTATAELAWGLLIMCVRNMRKMVRHALNGKWLDRESLRGRQLSDMTLGVLGFGRLGKMTARFGRAFCKKVLVCDSKPFPEVFQGWSSMGMRLVDFDTLLAESDAISIHIHMSPDNYHIFNSSAFSKMKKGAVLINTSRGDIIDEQALINALDSGRISAFGADVLHDEWCQNMSDNTLVKYAQNHENVVITPHMGGGTFFTLAEARRFMANKLIEIIKKEELQ